MGHLIRALRGYVSLGVGIVACPCHLPLTLPLVLSLTAGTAFGVWLAAHTALLYGLSTLIFIGGMALGMVWLNANAQFQLETKSEAATKLNKKTPHHHLYRPDAKG